MPVFEVGNNAAGKSPKVVIRKLLQMLDNAKTDDTILCFQDACDSISWRDSKVNYWASKIPVFATIKKDIQNSIVRRINKGALTNKMNNAAAIWRMKQLGEKDQQYMQSDNVNKNINKELTGEEKEAEIQTLKKQLDELSDY